MVRPACVVVLVLLGVLPVAAQDRGYLAIDEQGGRHAFSFRGEADAVNMCGTTACEVVATFSSCLGVAYSSPSQGRDVWTWLETTTEGDARVGALNECQAAGGAACEVLNVYCIDAAAVEAALGLDQSTRRRMQEGLGAAGFAAGAADGLFGPRSRQAIRRWQASRGAWATGYLTGAQVEALRSPVGQLPQMPTAAPAAAAAAAATAEQENLFWQSVMNSTNPARVRGVSGAVPERRVQRVGPGAAGGPAVAGGGCGRGGGGHGSTRPGLQLPGDGSPR